MLVCNSDRCVKPIGIRVNTIHNLLRGHGTNYRSVLSSVLCKSWFLCSSLLLSWSWRYISGPLYPGLATLFTCFIFFFKHMLLECLVLPQCRHLACLAGTRLTTRVCFCIWSILWIWTCTLPWRPCWVVFLCLKFQVCWWIVWALLLTLL